MVRPHHVTIEIRCDTTALAFFNPLDAFSGAPVDKIGVTHTGSIGGDCIEYSEIDAVPSKQLSGPDAVEGEVITPEDIKEAEETRKLVADVGERTREALARAENELMMRALGFGAIHGTPQDAPKPTLIVDKYGKEMIVEPLSIFDTSRHQPRPALLQGRMNVVSPLSGGDATHELTEPIQPDNQLSAPDEGTDQGCD